MATKVSMEEANRQKDIIKEMRQMVDAKFAETGKRLTYFITTFGCEMNLAV